MGRFEDLVQQAREGDAEALDALETEFSGSALREKAEKAESLEQELQKVRPLQRKARFDELVGKLDEGLQSVLSVDDVGDVEPNELTLEQLQDLATNKAEQRQATRLAAAQEAGFETVEEYESALETVKRNKEQRRQSMEDVGGGVASSGGEGGGVEPTRFDQGKEAFDAAKASGATDDIARAAFVDSLLQNQLEEMGAPLSSEA